MQPGSTCQDTIPEINDFLMPHPTDLSLPVAATSQRGNFTLKYRSFHVLPMAVADYSSSSLHTDF